MEYYRPEHVASSGTSSDKFYSCFGGISGPGESSGLKNPRPVGLKKEFFSSSQNMIFQIQPLRVVGSSPDFQDLDYSWAASILRVWRSSDNFFSCFGAFWVLVGQIWFRCGSSSKIRSLDLYMGFSSPPRNKMHQNTTKSCQMVLKRSQSIVLVSSSCPENMKWIWAV